MAKKEELRPQGNAAMARRRRWEQGDRPAATETRYPGLPGKERMTSASDVAQQQTETFIRDNKTGYTRGRIKKPVSAPPAAQLYANTPGQYGSVSPPMLDVGSGAMQPQMQIPGLENPDAVKTPPRWEELHPTKRADIEQRVRAKTGANIDSMTKAIGAQIDQAHMRAAGHGAVMPAAANFYSEGEPAQVMRRTAQEIGTSFGLVAAANAMTSPQVKFHMRHKETGEDVYPNNELAVQAIQAARTGIDPKEAKPVPTMGGPGFHRNFQKAVRTMQGVEAGGTLREVGEFGPKTSAYHNSWLPDTPPFFVSDVHSGGGGALPHLSSEKPYNRDVEGNITRTSGGFLKGQKSERERALEVQGVHSMIDYAARRAMAERGLTSMPEVQASQWQEERIQRGLVKEEHAYAPDPNVRAAATRPESNQMELFERTGAQHKITR